MAYTKTVWTDQNVENPRTYVVRDNGDDTVTLLDAFGEVTDLGTPVNATNMNHIENGIEEVDNSAVHKTGNETITGVKTFNNSIHFNSSVYIDNAAGYEGGEISFAKAPNSSLTADIYLDSWKNSMRIFGWDSNNVNHLVFDANIEENKVKVPTPEISSNDNTAATTAYVKNVLSALYPVGSIYIGTQSTCPLASLISGSQWQLVSQDRALWGGNGSNANTTINAGLPNITGSFGSGCLMNWQDSQYWGALYRGSQGATPQNAGGTDGGTNATIAFNAASSNSIYGSSSTVQPPAYRVNVWRRTA